MPTAMDSLASTETGNADHDTRDQPGSTSKSSAPRTRILPQPIETASRSSRRNLPQPTETSTRSSRNKKPDEQPERRKFLPEPIETTKSSNRAPSSSVSSSSSAQTTRRALPQPIETASMSSKGSQKGKNVKGKGVELSDDTAGGDGEKRSRRKHLPEPIESVKVYKKHDMSGAGSSSTSLSSGPTSGSDSPMRAASRRFAPQLIETAKRSFRKGEATAALAMNGNADNLLEYSGHFKNTRLPKQSADTTPPSQGSSHHTDPSESRFSYASLLSRQENREPRRHSFRVPDLPSIPSNSSPQSGQSAVSSHSTSPSSPADENAQNSKIRRQCRESCDERFSGYLLSLAARSAEKQLIDQTLAAFPNEQVYQPVSHFAIDREDEDDDTESDGYDVEVVLRDLKRDIGTFRRESTVDLQFELERLRDHKECAETKGKEVIDAPHESRFSAAAIAAKRQEASVGEMADTPKNIIGGWQKEIGLAQMRQAASPPMLGQDIVFPQSVSPKTTRCDVDHVPVPQQGEANNETPEKENPLWSPGIQTEDTGGVGLWKGMCKKTSESDERQQKIPRLGIMTPAPETENQPFFQNFESALTTANGDAAPTDTHQQFPNTPPESDPYLENIDKAKKLEEEINREFNDDFVTQIYNYLSLGYPATAHCFDFELSKISRIPVEDLRHDDQYVNAKGYIGAPEGCGIDQDGIAEKCMRWTALRLYIREWARQQQPWMDKQESSMDAWGARARRGSWAF